MWKCKNVTLELNHEVRTLQLDLLNNCTFNFGQLGHMGGIVWNQIHDTQINFLDRKDLSLRTGFKQMQAEYPDSHEPTDQFIIRLVGDKLLQERCIRLKNGHLSTEREAVDWDKRNEIKKQEFVDGFLKESGLKLNRDPDAERLNRDRNAPCSCGSGKKYKKCCQGKKKAGGSDVIYKWSQELYFLAGSDVIYKWSQELYLLTSIIYTFDYCWWENDFLSCQFCICVIMNYRTLPCYEGSSVEMTLLLVFLS